MKLSLQELSQFAREQKVYRRLLSRIGHSHKPSCVDGMGIMCIGNSGGADNVVHGRPSGGMLLNVGDRKIIVDPGENSLAYLASLGFDPYSLTDVLASHAHNDHAGDLALAVSGALKLGLDGDTASHIVVCPSLVDYGTSCACRFGFMLPAYAWKGNVHALYFRDSMSTRFDGLKIRSVRSVQIGSQVRVSAAEARHGNVMVTGFIIDTPYGRVGYTSDTEFFERISSWYAGVDVLWMNMSTLALESSGDGVVRPTDPTMPIHYHLGYVGVCNLIEEVQPAVAIVSHFGAQLLAQRKNIEAMLRQRFAGRDIAIHCPRNGDSYAFTSVVSEISAAAG